MERMTEKAILDKRAYLMDEALIEHDESGYFGEAVDRLAGFENFYFDVLAQQQKISGELERLRGEDKTKTAKFKQLLVEKLTNSNLLTRLEYYGLK